jgi:beta-glucosidase
MTMSEADESAEEARTFPTGFLWGASTAAYQVEGAAFEDGRGPSIWDTFSHTPGMTRGGDTGDVACDFYHRMDGDLDLMKSLGLDAFRFSIAWPRVQADGRGAVNQRGLDFYRRLVDGLRGRGIVPAATLYHWDLPQPLEDAGGWTNRDTAERFADYAGIVAEAIGEAVGIWITVNEPQVVAHQGYRVGTHAPGRKDAAAAAAATHHLLLAHGLALPRLRAALPAGARVGISLDLHPIRAVDAGSEQSAAVSDAEQNRIFLDPVLHGRYPAAAREELVPSRALIQDRDLELISAPIDFLGVNYYSPHYVRAADWTDLRRNETPIAGRPDVVDYCPDDLPRTTMGWLIEPDALYDLLCTLETEAPGLPLYVTENGCAAEDYVDPDGVVNDFERIAYLSGHFDAAWRAVRDGVNLAGYFVWSLLDNFEWAWGYQKRFGLVYVDFATQTRIPKRSAEFIREVALANALTPGPMAVASAAHAPDGQLVDA